MSSLKETMLMIRKEHIAHYNTRYHEVMKSIVDEEKRQIQLSRIRNEILDKFRENPSANNVSYTYTMNLAKLVQMTPPKERTANEEETIYEFWLECSSKDIVRVIFDPYVKNNNILGQFSSYLRMKDPHVKEIVTFFKEAFPEAIITTFLTCYDYIVSLDITIDIKL